MSLSPCSHAGMSYDLRTREYRCPQCGLRIPEIDAPAFGVPMMQPRPVPAVPDYFEPILAWRVWGLKRVMRVRAFADGEQIVSTFEQAPRLLSRGVTWEPFEALEARHWGGDPNGGYNINPRCQGSPCDGHVPHQAPKCGVYGFKTAERLRNEVLNSRRWGSSVGIIGAVWLWGRLVEHEHGWRAQFAYPARFVWLDLYDGEETTGPQLAEAYGVPYEEDASWKSANQSDEWFRNLFRAQYQSGIVSMFNLSPRVPFHPGPIQIPLSVPKSRSLSLYRPSDLRTIAEPTLREIAKVAGVPGRGRIEVYDQPSFHIHRPICWWKDGAGLWRRSERVSP